MGLYADLNPSKGGAISWETKGKAPNRVLEINYDKIPQFQDNSKLVTAKIAFSETTNNVSVIIDTYQPVAGYP